MTARTRCAAPGGPRIHPRAWVETRRVEPAIRHRRTQGFMLPLGDGLRGPLKPLMTDLRSPGRLARRGWFDARHVERMLTEHITGRRVYAHQVWSLRMFELWAQHVLERNRA